MSQPFSFPPPPPAPPKRNPTSNTNPRGGQRGRGQLGGFHSRGSFQSSRGRGFQNPSHTQYGRGGLQHRSPAPAPKRDHVQAFGRQAQSKPRAPPAVPSFDVDIKSLLPRKDTTTDEKSIKRKNNVLGLTPAAQDPQSGSEDDADDEIKLASATVGADIKFEHNGQTLLLRTPAEIAAWIAERRKKFPTQAKADAARKKEEEKRKQWEEQKKARAEAARLKREARDNERKERELQKVREKLIAAQVAKAKSAVAMSKEDVALKAREKAEKLRNRAEKAARDLEKAEAALNRSEQSGLSSKPHGDGGESDLGIADVVGGESEQPNFEATSSSGSSETDTDTDLDAEPEESTSKRTGPDRVAPPKQDTRKTLTEGRTVCITFQKYGNCKYGKKCRFLHERTKEKRSTLPNIARRKGLYEIMVEKEKEEEMRRAVRAIIALGDQGLLEEPQSSREVQV